MKVVSVSMLIASTGSIWMATFRAMRRPSVELQPHALACRAGGDAGAAVENLRPPERLQRAGQSALPLARGGDVEPGVVIGGVEQRAAERRPFGARVVAGLDGAGED